MGHAYLRNISDFFLKRLYAKGSLSITDTIIALKEAGETLHTANGEYDDVDDLQMGVLDLIIFLRQGHRFERFSLESFTKAATSKERKLRAYIIPAGLSERQKESLLEYDAGESDEWEEADWCEFEHIRWKYAPGWRMKYQKIPRLDHVEH